MNNDDLKRFMKQEINLDIKDCLGNIKQSEVEVDEPCLTNTRHARKARKIAFYSLFGLVIVSASGYQAYRYCTPRTYITIEVGHPSNELKLGNEEKAIDSFFIKVNLNDFNHVIKISTTNRNIKNLKMAHMKYQDAFPIIVEKLLDFTNNQKDLTFTIYSDDTDKYSSIEEFLKTQTFKENYQQVHINEYDYKDNDPLPYAKRVAIEEILKRSEDYTEDQLKNKSISQLLDILMKL